MATVNELTQQTQLHYDDMGLVFSAHISVAAQLLSNINNYPPKIISILLHIILIIQYYID